MMKRKKYFLRMACIFALISTVLISSCSSGENHEHGEEEVAAQTFTCPMHPQIVQDKPGVCPVCSMDLVPFDRPTEGESLLINKTRQALANITVMSLDSGSLSSQKVLNGRLVLNPEQTTYVSSRVSGRIEHLYIKELGVEVRKGQAIYQIYSEQLSVLQQEYLLAIAQVEQFPQDAKFAQIKEAAKQKLLLYKQSSAQIEALAKTKKVDANATYFAPESGVVAELSIVEGQYVEEGSPVLRLENYNTLWVEADIYPNEAAQVSIGQEVKVVIPGWENTPQQMKVQFVNPSLQSGSQLLQIRGSIPNPHGQWQTGQQATIFLAMKSGGHSLTLPVDAVIRTGTGTHVWIETMEDTFEARQVETGKENFQQVEIKSGLKPGDRVVITGTYLLNSEYLLKRGGDPMAMHQH